MMRSEKPAEVEYAIICPYCLKLLNGSEVWEDDTDVCKGHNPLNRSHMIYPDCLLEHFPPGVPCHPGGKQGQVQECFQERLSKLIWIPGEIRWSLK